MAAAEKTRRPPVVVRDGGPRLVEGRHTLAPEATSARQARHLLRDALRSVGREAWLDSAELIVSEVVTNAALHAHTPIDLWFGVYEDEVCVEVRDRSPFLPVQREYDLQASTGRGMGLVAALARACGVHPLGDDGKVIWFCVADPEPLSSEQLLASWDIELIPDDAATAYGTRDVVLPSMPLTLWLSARQHHDAILRELVLYLASHPEVTADVVAADAARAMISTRVAAVVEEAQAAGDAEPALPSGHPAPLSWVPRDVDLTMTVPEDSSSAFATLQDTLDLAERLAVAGELLTRPGLPEIVAVRDWACEQLITQLAGGAASPWPGTDHERFEREVHDRAGPPLPDWDATVVSEAATGAVAADDANRIIAVSRPLAAALGWSPAELIGRRVVTLVPPQLREAHVAGFSRHLSTGEAHVLGVPLELPVLARDGSIVPSRFFIEQHAVNAGRTVYVAWVDPLEPDAPRAAPGPP